MWKELDTPIDAFVVYRQRAVRPDLRAFAWQGRRYEVEATDFVHSERTGETVFLCYSVQCGAEQFAIRFDTERHRWRIEAIDVAS